jgi:uncharacterized Fe-S cluster protein YjdI
MTVVKRYSKDDITVVWKPEICIHAGECVKRLPEVYRPDEKPWIDVSKAEKAELIEQIKACPSGALSFELPEEDESDSNPTSAVTLQVTPNGPIMVQGEVKLKVNGEERTESRLALCRCGASSNKPYCDGSHKSSDFKGD